MFEFTETIEIAARPETVWETLREVERWWPESNPEHEGIERLDEGELGLGTRFVIRERIAGIPGEASGAITRFEPGSEVTWEAPMARYRWLGLRFTIGEGVSWKLAPSGTSASQLSAHVWATFPEGLVGRTLEWTFKNVLNGVPKDREHAQTELRYLKTIIETSTPKSR